MPIFVNVTVQAGSSGLQLRVTSDANPDEVTQTSNLFTLNAGQPAPPAEEKIQFNTATITNGTRDPTGTITVSRNTLCIINVQVINNSGQNASFNLSMAKQAENPANAWTALYSGNAIEPINAGQTSPLEQIRVTPSGTAVSVQIVFTASATILGSTVSSQLIIQFAAVP